MCLCDNIGLVALILLGWELHASYITLLCVQAIMILFTLLCVQAIMILSSLLFMPPLYSHSNLKNFYVTCILRIARRLMLSSRYLYKYFLCYHSMCSLASEAYDHRVGTHHILHVLTLTSIYRRGDHYHNCTVALCIQEWQ